MTMDGGNQQVCIPFFLAYAAPIVAAALTANGPVFAMRNLGFINPTTPTSPNTPSAIAINKVRVGLVGTAAFTAGTFALEVHKATSASQMTGGTQVPVQLFKTSDHRPISSTEIDAVIATNATLGNAVGYTYNSDTPFHSAGSPSTTLPAFFDTWLPVGGVPNSMVLEQNGGIVIENVIAAAGAGTALLYVLIEGFRF